jgi:hypothetical protein
MTHSATPGGGDDPGLARYGEHVTDQESNAAPAS